MALSDNDMALLRDWIQEPLSEAWNDDRLNRMYDLQEGDLRATAAEFWRIKAASAVALVDVSENGSSRKLSDLHKNFQIMADRFSAPLPEDVALQQRPRTRAITRP